MKKIKIKFSGFWDGFDYKDFLIYKILTSTTMLRFAKTPIISFAVVSAAENGTIHVMNT